VGREITCPRQGDELSAHREINCPPTGK